MEVEGVTLGLISMVRKSLKLAWGCMECSFFSSCISQPGARWTFSSITHRPDFTAVLMSRSALLKPSAEPERRRKGSRRLVHFHMQVANNP